MLGLEVSAQGLGFRVQGLEFRGFGSDRGCRIVIMVPGFKGRV
jgi:hypothetical protein